MSTELIGPEKDYGFTLTKFAGGADRGLIFQIDEGGRFVQLSKWQMLQLVCAFVIDNNIAPRLPQKP